MHDLGGEPGWGALHRARPDEPAVLRGLGATSVRARAAVDAGVRHQPRRVPVRDRAGSTGRSTSTRATTGAGCTAPRTSCSTARSSPRARSTHGPGTLRGEAVAEPPVPEPHRPTTCRLRRGRSATIDTPPAYAVGDRVRARDDLHPPGHTRLAGYVRGARGVVDIVQPAQVLPDTARALPGREPAARLLGQVRLPRAVGGRREPFDAEHRPVRELPGVDAMTEPADDRRRPRSRAAHRGAGVSCSWSGAWSTRPSMDTLHPHLRARRRPDERRQGGGPGVDRPGLQAAAAGGRDRGDRRARASRARRASTSWWWRTPRPSTTSSSARSAPATRGRCSGCRRRWYKDPAYRARVVREPRTVLSRDGAGPRAGRGRDPRCGTPARRCAIMVLPAAAARAPRG